MLGCLIHSQYSLVSLTLLLVLLFLANGILAQKETTPYNWYEKEQYYFTDLEKKFQLMDIHHTCNKSYKILPPGTIQIPQNSQQVYITSIPHDPIIQEWWLHISPAKQHRVDPLLCQAPYLKKKPIFENNGCMMTDYMSKSAPRCQSTYLKYLCNSASAHIENSQQLKHFIMPEANHGQSFLPPIPWLLTARDSFITVCGQISLSCGSIHTTANCMAQKFRADYSNTFKSGKCAIDKREFVGKTAGDVIKCNQQTLFNYDNGIPAIEEVVYYPRVFVVAEVDDTFVYHIHLEIVPRIAYHLQFLLDNPDIMILWGCDTKDTLKKTTRGLSVGLEAMIPYIQMLGINSDRIIIHKNVFANEIYLPMEGGCQDPVYNTWQILNMRRMFLSRILMDPWITSAAAITKVNRKPNMMLIRRSADSKSTRNVSDLVRQWSEKFTKDLLVALASWFPEFNVLFFNDRDENLMSCLDCQMKMFHDSDVVIGMHGAGLSNMIYMKPNGAVVEFAPYGNDGRLLLGGGPFNRASVLLSHDYMVHYALRSEFAFQKGSASFNVTRFMFHIHSFLVSTGRLTSYS